MPRHRPALVLSVLLITVLLLDPSPRHAGAQDGAPADTTTEWSDNTLVVTAAAPGTLTLTDNPGAPYDGPRIHCAWFALAINASTLDAVHIADPQVGVTYVYNCWFTDPWADRYPGYPLVAVYDPVVDSPGPLITTPIAARHALDSIEFERPSVVTSPTGINVVGVPSWLAVDSELEYGSASAQAGPVWATVRPVFRDVTWDLGNGVELACTQDATTMWDPTGPETQTSGCTHTFTRARRALVSATVNWTVWQRTDRTIGSWVVWGTVSLTTAVELPVVDLQAVID